MTLKHHGELSDVARNLRRIRIAVGSHDVANPTHTTTGVAMRAEDAERLGFEIGEELWAGITLYEDSGELKKFRIICDGEHDLEAVGSEQVTETENIDQKEPVYA